MLEAVNNNGLKPGIYFGLSFEDYANDPAMNYSSMKSLLDCPYTFSRERWHGQARKEKSGNKRDLLFGRAAHKFVFEQSEFLSEYNVIPLTKIDPKKTMITLEEYKSLTAMHARLMASEDVPVMVEGEGYPEVSIFWLDPIYNIMCKARHDKMKSWMSVDYKTRYDLSDRLIKKAFWDFGYHIQNYHYVCSREYIRTALLAGLADFYGDVDDRFIDDFLYGVKSSDSDKRNPKDFFSFIFQRPTKPYPVRPIFLTAHNVNEGRKQAESALKIYCDNMEKYGTENEWIGLDGKMEEFDMRFGSAGEI
jgi:hypothetical protein